MSDQDDGLDPPRDKGATIAQLPVRPKPAPTASSGPLRVVDRHFNGPCKHVRVVVDEQLAEVTCEDCGVKLNPIWVLTMYAKEDGRLADRWARMRAEVRLLAERTRCKCAHCGAMTPIPQHATSGAIVNLAARIKREESVDDGQV